jgi:XisH protein
MPAKDIYHEAVKKALIKDGWNILGEGYTLEYGGDNLYVDIAASKPIAAERDNQRILVEVKSFLGRSFMNDLEMAIGQYIIYRDIVETKGLNFKLYLAVTVAVYDTGFQKQLARLIVERNQVNLLIFDPDKEVLLEWTS